MSGQFAPGTKNSPDNESVCSDSAVGPPVNVLMIDDDKSYYVLVRRLLMLCKDQSFNCMHAVSVADALAKLTFDAPDIILLDLGLPDSDGLSTFSKIAEKAIGIPIIVLTGSDDHQNGLRAIASGAQDFLVKHLVSNDALIRCLRYAIERKKFEESTLRMAAIRDFTETLAHDLRVPLLGARNVLIGLLNDQFGPLSDQQKSILDDLSNSNDKQLTLLQKLIEIYRYEGGTADLELQPWDLSTLIQRYVREVCTASGIEIELEMEPGTLSVVGDGNALRRLFINLLDNAVQFSDGSRNIAVKTAQMGSKVIVSIENPGPAIPQQIQAQMFQRFWQGVPGQKYVAHTGFGLYLCHRITSLHRGRISCDSYEGCGTTITVTLPLG